jgi:hypothetical protein
MVVEMNALWLLLTPLVVGLFGSFLMELTLKPVPVVCYKRPRISLHLHVYTWLLVFALVLLVVRRPWFAVFILWAFQYLVVLVNQAKYSSLREPFLVQDFDYFTDAIKHPRLYLPFFGIGRTVAVSLGFSTAVVLGLRLENALDLTLWLTTLGVLLPGMLIGLLWANQRLPAVSFSPEADLIALGQFGFFWTYFSAEQRTDIAVHNRAFNPPAMSQNTTIAANIVVVQSESFFDPRSLSTAINTDVLTHFDALKKQAYAHGRLRVPAWGANTVRTECGFLTGLTAQQLGIHQFNPYRSLANNSLPNLVSYLKHLGYRTACVHPYPSHFYLRDQVYPRLGFDHFLDIKEFTEQQKEGQYIGDAAVTEKVLALLEAKIAPEQERAPWFIFVITMENHGPLHLEKISTEQAAEFYTAPPETGLEELSVYLRHLKNADSMLNLLQKSLQTLADTADQPRAGLLCWYGDHVPIMESVYQQLSEPDGLTDYLIWQTRSQQTQLAPLTEQTIDISTLATTLLKASIPS